MAIKIRTDGDFSHREDLVDLAGSALDEATRTGALMAAARHAREDVEAKEEALDHPDMTPELAEVLSTSVVELEISRETKLETTQNK
jgi:hypothetical protein